MLAVAVALAAAVRRPLPSAWVERVYSRGLYPRIQSIVTPVSALTSIALLDGAVAILLTTALVLLVRRARTHGARAAFGRALAAGIVTAAIVYLWFLLFWGLNYRRVPLEQKLVYDPSRITRDQGLQLARTAVERVNGLVEGAKAAPPDDLTLMKALNSVRASLRDATCDRTAAEAIAAHALLPPRRHRRHDRSLLPRGDRQCRSPAVGTAVRAGPRVGPHRRVCRRVRRTSSPG